MPKALPIASKYDAGITTTTAGNNTALQAKAAYPFVDLIRFIAMMGIVFAHTDALPPATEAFDFFKTAQPIEAYIIFKQTFKFSVVCFFMISGFLLGDKIGTVKPVQYFRRRLKSTLRPFLIAFVIFLCLVLISDRLTGSQTISLKNLKSIYYIIFYTPYWYLPTYFIGLFSILLFSKYLDSIWLGIALLTVTLAYTFPALYGGDFGSHSTSVFAFVFYLWLGVYIRRKNLSPKIKALSPYLLVLAILVFFCLACIQSYTLLQAGNRYFFNNLRVFNQVYGLLVFIFLIRISPAAPHFFGFNPRKETYGIYLYHFPVILFVFPAFAWLFQTVSGHPFYAHNLYLTLVFSFLKFGICYVLTLLLVKAMIKFKLPVL